MSRGAGVWGKSYDGHRAPIVLGVAGCATTDALYECLLSALDAPDWHGHNLDALWDSIARGGINGVEPPYSIDVVGAECLPMEVMELLDRFEALFREAKESEKIEVEFNMRRQSK